MAQKIVCRFCNAEFDEMLPKCPYCNSTNYVGAEAEYFDKLEDVRDDMEDLGEVPEEEAKRAFLNQWTFLKKVFLVLGIIALVLIAFILWEEHQYDSVADGKEDFLWKEENYPLMDQLYEAGKYDELMDFYMQAIEDGNPTWDWEHSDFCNMYLDVYELERLLEIEAAGKEMLQSDYTELLYVEFSFVGIATKGLDEQERAAFAEYEELALRDFQERWNMTDPEYNGFIELMEQNDGWIGYVECDEYVEKWYETR